MTEVALRLTTAQAAKRLGVSTKTMKAYADAGVIKPLNDERGPGIRLWFDPEEVAAYARGSAAGAEKYREKRDAGAQS